MMTLSDTAAEAVRDIVAGTPDLSDETGGLRLFAKTAPSGETGLELSLTDGPDDGDAVVASGDARVFLDPGVAPLLADKQLDAERGEESTQFVLRDQVEEQ